MFSARHHGTRAGGSPARHPRSRRGLLGHCAVSAPSYLSHWVGTTQDGVGWGWGYDPVRQGLTGDTAPEMYSLIAPIQQYVATHPACMIFVYTVLIVYALDLTQLIIYKIPHHSHHQYTCTYTYRPIYWQSENNK